MAKRFTDTAKWQKESFFNLSPKMKLVWLYICDNCDHAGFYDFNLTLLSVCVGEAVTRDEFIATFSGKVEWLSSSKIFIPAFIEFQYGDLNPDNRAHASVLARLKKEGAYKDLTSPLQGAKDKEKDKEQDKDKVLGESEGKISASQLESLYALYPKKEGKKAGLAKLKATVKTPEDYFYCSKALQRFRDHHIEKKTEAQFYPKFSTWANNWTDWLEDNAGQVIGLSIAKDPLAALREELQVKGEIA